MKDKKIGIYMILNTVNNKKYIGSSKDLILRRRDHFRRLRDNTHNNNHLQNAYNNYGANKFKFIVIEYCTINDIFIRERFWILKLKTLDKKYGYNNTLPNETGGSYQTEETKNKISFRLVEHNLGKSITMEEYNTHMNRVRIRYNNSNKIVSLTRYQEDIKNISKRLYAFDRNSGELVTIYKSKTFASTQLHTKNLRLGQYYSVKGLVLIEEKDYKDGMLYPQIKKKSS